MRKTCVKNCVKAQSIERQGLARFLYTFYAFFTIYLFSFQTIPPGTMFAYPLLNFSINSIYFSKTEKTEKIEKEKALNH